MTVEDVMLELKEFGDERVKNMFLKHGAREPFYGVKVQDLKKIQKKVKKDHQLSIDLFATGNSDAMYLAGLIADEDQITAEDLNRWADEATWYMISEYPVAWVASETTFGYELGLKWIESDVERIAAAGWSTLASVASIRPDEQLDINAYSRLLDRVVKEIHQAPNRVRYVMNQFVISTGSYITELNEKAKKIGSKIGKVHVDVGDTACKVPLATEYIEKVEAKGRVGKKRKVARC